jgi:AcrR family transcriptional regulator
MQRDKAAPPKSEPLFPKLAARRNASAEAVAAHQRARLHAAMIDACARHGYAETTARELAALAGVSTKTIYNHFASKEACLLATYDLVVQQAVGRISAASRDVSCDGNGDREAGLCRAFDAFAAELVERPAPSRLALIEILAAGPAALPRIEHAEALFTTMISGSLTQARDGRAIPTKTIRPLIGGIWFVARTRLLDPRPQENVACAAALSEWMMTYRVPADFILPSAPATRRAPATEVRPIDPARTDRLRLLRAAAAEVARGGYASLSPPGIAGAADLAVAAFDAEFEDTKACFLSMLEWLSADALAEALRESEGAASWAGSIYRAVRCLFHRVAADAALARAAFLDAVAIGPVGYERRIAIMRGFARTLSKRAPTQGQPDPLVAEAIVGSIWSIAYRHVASGKQEQLPAWSPVAAFVASAPIVGADASLLAIVDEQRLGD